MPLNRCPDVAHSTCGIRIPTLGPHLRIELTQHLSQLWFIQWFKIQRPSFLHEPLWKKNKKNIWNKSHGHPSISLRKKSIFLIIWNTNSLTHTHSLTQYNLCQLCSHSLSVIILTTTVFIKYHRNTPNFCMNIFIFSIFVFIIFLLCIIYEALLICYQSHPIENSTPSCKARYHLTTCLHFLWILSIYIINTP